MALELKAASRVVKGQVFIQPTDLRLEKGTMNVLLGPTLSGKTSLMRLMAGLDKPTAGSVWFDGKDIPKAAQTGATKITVRSKDPTQIYPAIHATIGEAATNGPSGMRTAQSFSTVDLKRIMRSYRASTPDAQQVPLP